MLFSPQGDKFAYYDPNDDLDVWDFDRCSGYFSNRRHVNINDTAAGGGVAFSSNGQFLYVSSHRYVYQFDVNDITNSQFTVAIYDGFQSGGLSCNFYLTALAPDGKIYINSGNGSLDLHVINNPDEYGLACNFQLNGQHCLTANTNNLPNMVNYKLGALAGSGCDTIINGLPPNLQSSLNSQLQVWPNPFSTDLSLSLSEGEGIIPAATFTITTITGQIVYQQQETNLAPGYTKMLDLSHLPNGVYFIEVSTAAGKAVQRVLKE